MLGLRTARVDMGTSLPVAASSESGRGRHVFGEVARPDQVKMFHAIKPTMTTSPATPAHTSQFGAF